MRSLAVPLLALSLVLRTAAPAGACDPEHWCGYDTYEPYWDFVSYEPTVTWWDEPVFEPEPAPVAAAPDPGAAAAALGLHRVTEVWVGQTTETVGAVTTYGTASAAADPGTYARAVATVGTGEASAYDSQLVGGRTTMSDGTAVAGVIYENFGWNGSEMVVTGYYLFQDDAETVPSAVVTPAPVQTSAPPAPAVTVAPPPAPTPIPVVVATTPPPVFAAPSTGGEPLPPTEPTPPPAAQPPPPRVVTAGIALASQADPLSRAEVLRGRRVALWVRAWVDAVAARVVSWRLLSGEVTALGPVSGTGDEPLVATWLEVGPPGATFPLRMRAGVDVPGEGVRELDVSIDVVVRSPAIVE